GRGTVVGWWARFGRRVLVASSSEIYGDHRDERPLRENDRRVYGPTTEKRWLYADSKAMDEHLAFAWHHERGLDSIVARLFNTVGPRQSGQYGMVIPRFVAHALAGEPIEIHGDGSQPRPFCHVADTILALRGLMEHRELSGAVFNVGSTERVAIIELAERIRDLTGSRSELSFVPYGEVYGLGIEDTLHREPSIGKISAAIGWVPTRSLDDLLAEVIAAKRAAGPAGHAPEGRETGCRRGRCRAPRAPSSAGRCRARARRSAASRRRAPRRSRDPQARRRPPQPAAR